MSICYSDWFYATLLILQQRQLQSKAEKVRAGVLEGTAGTLKSLTQTQEATGKAHLVIPVRLISYASCMLNNYSTTKNREAHHPLQC